MREEKWKEAVKEISKQPGYARIANICDRAIQADTATAYRDALHEIKSGPIMYAVTDIAVKRGLGEE